MVKLKELSNDDINDILTKLNLKINGIFSKDKLPPKLEKGFYIINMEASDKGNGTHWVCLYYIKPSMSYYFDSFGFPAPKEIQSRLSYYKYNENDIQNINSSACGYFCIAFVKFMTNKNDLDKSFKVFTDKLFSKNTIKNDNILSEFLNLEES